MIRVCEQKILKSWLDFVFELQVAVVLLFVTVGAVLHIICPAVGTNFPHQLEFLKIESLISIVLNLVLFLKLYKLLLFFFGKHNVVIYDLLEIGLTSIIISSVFDHEYLSYQKLLLLVVLFSFAVIMKVGEFKAKKAKLEIGLDDYIE